MSKSLELFKEITQIPHGSKKEGKIREYLVNWAVSKGFEYKIDSYGNLVIYVMSLSNSDSEPVILQSHIDMVCVKTSDSNHNFDTDSLDIYEEDGFLKARNTSLGADNGIGVALAMVAVDFENRPNLELIFTVEEEIGLLGALNFDFSLVSGKNIINIDSENDSEICISSAGGVRVYIKKEIESKEGKYLQYNLKVSGLAGGHSGVEIDKNQGNAVKILVDFLCEYGFSFELVSISGGTADNVIPSEVEAVIGTDNLDLLEDSLKKYLELTKMRFKCPNITYSIKTTGKIVSVIEEKDFILEKIKDTKIGVYTMSSKILNLVQTSMNLGIINLTSKLLELTYIPRSSDMEEFDNLILNLEKSYKNSGYEFSMDEKYPGWQDDPDGELVSIASAEFERINSKKPEILAVHAGLEPGALVGGLGKDTHAISIGPNMYDIHSINERLEIASVEKMEKILEGILSKLV